MQPKVFFCLLLLTTLLSCKGNKQYSSDPKAYTAQRKIPLAQQRRLYDTIEANLSAPQMRNLINRTNPGIILSRDKLNQKIDSLGKIIDLPQATFYSGDNFTGDSLVIKPGQYIAAELGFISTTGYKSYRMPLGVSADVIRATPFNNWQMGIMIVGLAYKITPSIVAKRAAPEKLSSVVLYPWTDFYFTSDDDSVPGWLDGVFIGVSGNENGQDIAIRPILNDKSKKYFRTVSYPFIPGQRFNLWESTKSGNSGWGAKIDTVKNVLTVTTWVSIRSPTAPRNWIGVRASLIPSSSK